jgi:hypothetical protein
MSPPMTWGHFVSNEQPAIRIFAPTGGYSSKEGIGGVNLPAMKKIVAEGQALFAGPPWPESIVGKNGELPQYVVADKSADGRLSWVAADPWEDSDKMRGFYYRARIDLELVVDGAIIDLNRVEIPDDIRLVDRRFGKD